MRSACLLALLLALPVAAQPVLVADINPGGADGQVSELEPLGEDVYFSAKGAGGVELWRYVTATGTAERVTNLPGSEGGSLKPNNLVGVAGQMFFTGQDDAHGRELWKYDPATNTYGLVADILPGPDPSTPNFSIAFNGGVYFRAFNFGSKKELWYHDPATNTTAKTPDIREDGSAFPREFVVYDDDLYYRAYDDGVGEELFRYDPVTNTNTLAVDIVPGPQYSEPKDPRVLDGLLYFFVRSPNSGPFEQLWSFDAATDLAVKLVDIPPGTGPDWGSNGLEIVDGVLYYFAGSADGADDLWRYDPVTATAALVSDLPPGSDSRQPSMLGSVAGVVYFAASADSDGRELWQYDTASGVTSRVADLASGAASSDPDWAIVHQDALYFSADDGVNGRELWRYQPPYLLTGTEGYRTLALPMQGLVLGGRGPGYLTNLWTAGYVGADRDQRNARGLATVFLYDEATGAFIPPARETSVSVGQGMWVFVNEDDEPYSPGLQGGFPKRLDPSGGTPYVGTFSFPVTRTATSPAPGFNLQGNPYDEAIDWDHPSWTKTDIGATVYVYDPDYNGGDYRTWNGTTGDLEGGVIAAGQAFTVEALSSSAVLTVTEDAKTGGEGTIQGKTPALSVAFRLGGTVDGVARETVAFVAFHDDAALGLDRRDGLRLASRPGSLRLFTEADGRALAIAALPTDLDGELVLPLHAEAVGADARATLAWDAAPLPAGWSARLVDRATGQSHDLTSPGTVSLRLGASVDGAEVEGPPVPRAIRVDAQKAGQARFDFVLTSSGQTAASKRSALVVEIGPNPARDMAYLGLTLPEAGEVTVAVFDALGRHVLTVHEGAMGEGTRRLALPAADLAPGTYVVRVETEAGAETRRLTVAR